MKLPKYLYDFVGLVFVGNTREKPSSMRGGRQDQLSKDAARAPNVHCFVVLPRAQQHLRRPVPARHDVHVEAVTKTH